MEDEKMYFIAPGNSDFFQKKKRLEMILYSLRKRFNPHTREISEGGRIKANEPCVDWFVQCVLHHGIQV